MSEWVGERKASNISSLSLPFLPFSRVYLSRMSARLLHLRLVVNLAKHKKSLMRFLWRFLLFVSAFFIGKRDGEKSEIQSTRMTCWWCLLMPVWGMFVDRIRSTLDIPWKIASWMKNRDVNFGKEFKSDFVLKKTCVVIKIIKLIALSMNNSLFNKTLNFSDNFKSKLKLNPSSQHSYWITKISIISNLKFLCLRTLQKRTKNFLLIN